MMKDIEKLVLAAAVATLLIAPVAGSAPVFAGTDPAEQPSADAPKGGTTVDCSAISDEQMKSDCLKNQEQTNKPEQGDQQKY